MTRSFPNPYRGLRGLPADVWVVAVTTLVNRAGMMALPFLVLYLTKHLGVSASLAGLSISAYGVGGLVTAPIAGRVADRIGPFAVLRGSLVLTGIVLLVMPLVKSFSLILVLTFTWALVADAARPATMLALTGSTPPEQRKAAVALNRLAVNLGMSVGPAVGGFLALVSFPLLFVVDGLTSLAAALVLSALLWWRRDAMHATEKTTPHEAGHRPRVTTGPLTDHAAVMFLAAAFLMNMVFSQHQGAMPLYLVRDLGYRESFYGGLFVLNTLIIVAIEVPLNVAMAHWNARVALGLSTFLVAVGFGALGLVAAPVPIAITVIVWTFGEMIFFPTAVAYVAELAPAGRTGEYMGVFSGAISLALIVGPWLGALMLDRYGASVTWSAVFVCGVAGSAICMLSRQGASVVPAIPEPQGTRPK